MATKKRPPEGDDEDHPRNERSKRVPTTTRARVLVQCLLGAPNDVVELADAPLSAAVQAGQADPHPDAVAYAESLRA